MQRDFRESQIQHESAKRRRRDREILLSPRIQRMRMRLMRFNIKQMIHVPGKPIYTSDTLSRLIARQPYKQPEQSLIPDDDMTIFIGSIIDTLPVSDVKLKQIIEAQDDDETCKRIKLYCFEE